jgi:1-acyl-sn-glycerol-3-phosphate acyltransferase
MTAPGRSSRSRHYQPTDAEIAAAEVLLEPWHWLTAPVLSGLGNVPTDRPVFFVGNHSLMGVLDVPLMLLALYERRGIFVRSLGDHLHFRIPVWRDLLARFGTVDGTRGNCRALMRAGESLLVFPGGGREVFKRKGEKYRLIWKNRIGFARLAIEFGYTIVPFSAVGAEDCYDILVDGNDVLKTRLGPVVERLAPRPDMIPPLVRGVGLSLLPKPQRFYFHFARPIETAGLAGEQNDEAVCFALRERVRRAVERGIALLLARRQRDPDRALGPRLLHQLDGSLAGGATGPPRRRRSLRARGAAPLGRAARRVARRPRAGSVRREEACR